MKEFIKNVKVDFKFKQFVSISSIILIVVDIASKLYADSVLKQGVVTVVDGFFNFALAYNTGVSFSMFNNLESGQYILATIAVVAGYVFSVLVLNSTRRVDMVGYGLISAGAYGNAFDRFMHGHVIDFLDFHYKNWHYPTFNFADCFIFIGVAIILLDGFGIFKSKSKSL